MFRNKLTGEGISFLTSKSELSRKNDESSHLENEIHAVNMLQFFLSSFGNTEIFLNFIVWQTSNTLFYYSDNSVLSPKSINTNIKN